MNSSDLKKWLAAPEQSRTKLQPASPQSPMSFWAEFAKTKTWLHKSSRSVDCSSTLSSSRRDHEVAELVMKVDKKKWLARPAVDSLSDRLQNDLYVSSTNPWLARKRPSETDRVSATLSLPMEMWLAKDRKSSASSGSPWLYDPSRAPGSRVNDPMRDWKEHQKGLNWLHRPSPVQRSSSDNERWLSAPSKTQELNRWLVSHTLADQNDVRGEGRQDKGEDISMWLAGGRACAASGRSKVTSREPLAIDTNLWLATPPASNVTPVMEDVEKWLLRSSSSVVTDDQDSVASVATLGSDFELVEEY